MMATDVESFSMASKGEDIIGDVAAEKVLGGRRKGTTEQPSLVSVDKIVLEVEDLGILNSNIDDWSGGQIEDANTVILYHTAIDVQRGTHLAHILVHEGPIFVVRHHHLFKAVNHCAVWNVRKSKCSVKINY